jgi:glycerol kinase
MSVNNLLMQIQSNSLQIPVERAKHVETTGLGAALLAGIGIGIFKQADSKAHLEHSFRPQAKLEFENNNWKIALGKLLN